jgi:AAA domain
MPSSDKAAVLDYWRAVELFSPQDVPRAAPNDPTEPVFSAREDVSLPWNPGHPLKSRRTAPGTSRRFQVYCGIYSLEKVRSVLEDKFGKDPESFDERSDGESCLFAFSVTDDGRPLFDTFVLSTCAWATARTLDPGPESAEWLVGFETIASTVAAGFAERLAASQDDPRGQELKGKGFNLGRPTQYADILWETKRIAQELGVPELSENREIRIKAGVVSSRKKSSADDQDFLNSFFVKDLGKVAAEVRKKNLGNGLWTFLAGDDELDLSRRIDIRKSINILFQQLSPALFPPGRWPSKDHHPLVFSQQVAMNSMVQDLMKGSGLFAVNGPPGTGKTTLLRDLIAAAVVERATCLAKLARPEDAFAGEMRWRVGKFHRVISTWKDEFRGFEIVVASTNNGAVENVTLEIPGKDAIDPSWLGHSDYFPDFANRLIDQPAWGMVGARLGNKKNRNDFVSRFWYGDKEAGEAEEEDPSASGFLKLLRGFENQPADWGRAVRRFKEALARERCLRDERVRVHRTYLDVFNLLQELPALDMKLKDLTAERQLAIQEFHEAQANERKLTSEVDEAKHRRLEHRRFRPGILEFLFTLGKAFREWRGKDKTLEALIEQVERQLTEGKNQAATRQQDVASLDQNIQQTTTEIEQKRQRLAAAREELHKAQAHLGAYFPLPDTWDTEAKARERSSPWADPQWNEARAKVFLEALQLHKVFIAANADTMRKSLQGTMDVLSGAIPETAPPEGVEAAWTTLFFVIPVISTTFASFDRLFSHLGRESLGWLLIDEAGQAVPQAAAGAIWRAKRSVVVGDPLQLEPVITIPFTVQRALRKYYKADETWLPGSTSVQQLTDRVSALGTYLNGPDGPIWVGSPLRVHRRCDQPMFDISNTVAYDGLMVFGTPPRRAMALPPSSWFHVESTESEGHWIPAEGRVVETLIGDLMSQGISADDMFLISPFRAVMRRLLQIASRFDIKAGTIHTAQGKESDVVILVLGGDPRRPRAKRFAWERPNLLNVAVSRAKRRLYVVGNQDAWKQYRYFGVCAAVLQQWNGAGSVAASGHRKNGL